jgi:hypothetical protein
MRLPAWLDPWWHMDFALATSLGAEEIRAVLTRNPGELRGRLSEGGDLRVVRRGHFLNQFVRARVEITARGGETVVSVHVARPPVAAWFFVLSLPFLWLGVISQMVHVGIRSSVSGAAS